MIPIDNIHDQIKKLRLTASAHLDTRVRDAISRALAESEMTVSPHTQANIWRTIMKSRITKLAAAAAIIIAVLAGVHQFGASAPAFAEIVQPLLTARTATFKMTFDIEGSPHETFDCMFMEPGRTREVRPAGVIRILDHHQGQTIMLYPAGKKAIIFQMTNMPEDQQSQTNWFHGIREEFRRAQKADDESVKFLGKHQIDGVMAFGYRTGKNGDRTVWADAETLLPIRIEYSVGKWGLKGIKGTITYSDFVFDVEMDESLFVVPKGYDVNTLAQDASENREEDLIQALRLWSENTDGTFPAELELNIKAAGKLFQQVKEKMGLKFEEGKAPDFTNPQFSEFYLIRLRIIRGLGFTSRLRRSSDSDWHYAGKGVKLGDAERPIFWYRPKGSDTYRVIYGDLNVKDVGPENLPK